MSKIKKTLKQRGGAYGSFFDNANCTQELMGVVEHRARHKLTTSEVEAIHMIMHKISRIIIGNKTKKDNWHDIAGYAMLAEDLTKDQK